LGEYGITVSPREIQEQLSTSDLPSPQKKRIRTSNKKRPEDIKRAHTENTLPFLVKRDKKENGGDIKDEKEEIKEKESGKEKGKVKEKDKAKTKQKEKEHPKDQANHSRTTLDQ